MNGCDKIEEHNCYDPCTEHWHNTKYTTWTTCGRCKRVTGFHYKRFSDRLKALLKFKGVNPVKI